MVSLTIAGLLATAYLVLQLYYIYHWRKTPIARSTTGQLPATPFSIVLVAHNEAQQIIGCLDSILQQSFPQDLMEIIVIDDRSTDQTPNIVRQLTDPRISLYRLEDYPDFIHAPAYKKSGIELGVHLAQNEWIIVTDADCTHDPGWLHSIADTIENNDDVFFAAPVLLERNYSVLSRMQQSENLALMLVTAAGITSGWHDMANGANMIFSKKAFIAVEGYKENYQYSSGDDMFLIEKMRQQFPDKVSFIKSIHAVATTTAKESWKALIRQRLRWAGKNKGLRKQTITLVWGFIGLYHAAIVILLLLALLHVANWWPFLILASVKLISDFLLLRESASFFGQRINFLQVIPQQVLYAFYLGYLGWLLMLGRKGDW